MFSDQYNDALSQIASLLGIYDPAWLYNVIAAESAWNPAAYNKASGAVGLIQFIPRTLMDYGLLSAPLAARIPKTGKVPEDVKQAIKAEFLAKYPTVTAQLLGPVLQYFKRYRPFPTEQSVYLTVFYPAYRSNTLDTVFPDTVRAYNPGINTVGDYVNFVKKKSNLKAPRKSACPSSAPDSPSISSS